ncbi:HK97 gp10 family phage protein [Enterococcus dongliensis]|uniref:HK97 gp10 family phage protein n=1 Tax=Enterococcus dongliensis TaxID=2559925 RepID=UPI00288C8F15|nr:HK97 gp10 family phage protein [Enterococcus dongliensis]MDT2674296.1 HK97 gp10 family phage protein [Enterococcus dongliensis]
MAKSFKITGLNKLSSKLKKNVTMNDVKQVVKNNTAELTNVAQRNAPVDTGFLKRSIVMELANGGYVGRSIAGAEYAPC